MKKTVLFIASAFVALVVSAQSEKYINAMKANVQTLDTIHTATGWLNAANAFQRIADAEKNQWLPYYYAALGNVMNGMFLGQGGKVDATVTDQLADKADELISKAENFNKDNSEIFVVKKLIATLRMMADPQSRWQQYGPMAAEALAKAKQLNPENPRVYLLEGQDKFFTPEQFGGSKTEAKKLFEESKKKFETFKPESEIHPAWGLNQLNYFMGMTDK
jgi:hypothetical protein